MKRHLTRENFKELPPKAQLFIFAWQRRKGYSADPCLSIGDCIELLIDLSPEFHHDLNLSGWYDNTLYLGEVGLGWDGDELIDILFWHVKDLLVKRINSGMFIL